MSNLERFNKWYSTSGHWIYQTRAEALHVWQTVGIEGLPNFQLPRK